MTDGPTDNPTIPVLTCPICGIAVFPDNPFKPFCSKRHKEVDLNRWLSNFYRIETDEAPAEDQTPPAAAD